MSMRAQFQRLTKRSAAFRQQIFGESITIWKLDQSSSLTLTANLNIGPSAQTITEGGFYDQDAISAEILAEDLRHFPLAQEMFVTVCGKEMRIASFTPGKVNYRLVLVPRSAPAAR